MFVVDDEAQVADLYSTWLEREYAVRTAYSSEEALETVDEDVDVVFLDRQMPRMTGDAVLEELRDRNLDCRVVIVTAIEPDFDIVDMPFDDYLTKPVMKSDLRTAARRMLARDAYDKQIREYFALASKKAALEAQKDPIERRKSERYRELEAKLRRIARETDRLASEMEHQDPESLFREVPVG